MKISCCRYRLTPMASIGAIASSEPREGALLKVDFPGIGVGYADCHPWPELGDLPLLGQLQKLSSLETTPLTSRSLSFAQVDAQARSQGISLFQEIQIPSSHFLVPKPELLESLKLEDLSSQGFRQIKIKLGREPKGEAKLLLKVFPVFLKLGLKMRLDFNSSLSVESFEQFLEELGPARECLDFIEDPFVFESIQFLNYNIHYSNHSFNYENLASRYSSLTLSLNSPPRCLWSSQLHSQIDTSMS